MIKISWKKTIDKKVGKYSMKVMDDEQHLHSERYEGLHRGALEIPWEIH